MNLIESASYVRVHGDTYKQALSPLDIHELFNSIVGEPNVKLGREVAISENDVIRTAYTSYMLLSSIGGFQTNNHTATVGLVFSATQNVIKIFSGLEASACLNLAIFGPQYVKSVENIYDRENLNVIQNYLNDAVNVIAQQVDRFNQIYDVLNNRTFTPTEFQKRKGEVLSRMPFELIHSYIPHSERLLREPTSIYFDMPHSDWQLLSTFTDKVKNISPARQITDTLSLEKIFI